MAQVVPNMEHPVVVVLNESEEYRFGGLFRIIRAQLQFQQFDQHLSDPITRICFERGDSVGVLLYIQRRMLSSWYVSFAIRFTPA